MAIISSHALNGVDGTHANGIGVKFVATREQKVVFYDTMDNGGRLFREISGVDLDKNEIYELIFDTGDYWRKRDFLAADFQIIEQVVIRFNMPDLEKKYHIPLILNPHSYSVWTSG